MTIADLNVPHSPSTVNDGPPPSRREAALSVTLRRHLSRSERLLTHEVDFISKRFHPSLDLTRQRRISLLPRHLSFLISNFSFLPARKEQFLISHFSFLICFLRPEKTKNPSQRTQKTYIPRGVKNIYAVPPNFSRKLCPSFPSITRTSRRILISALSLKLWNRGSKKK